jgi:hypothetical protein
VRQRGKNTVEEEEQREKFCETSEMSNLVFLADTK